jgi:L-alanine-DL-glutamate epimerase-like enolase superfamily enzyme
MRARDLMAAGFRCVKLKVSADADAIEAKLRAMRAAVGDGVRIRLDPNAAWHPADAVSMLRRFARYRLDYVEQPLASIEQLAELRAATGVPLAADESATTADAVREIAARRAADVIVVKPALLGPRAALDLIRVAQGHGLAVTVTSVFDTSIGIAAALHVAAAAPAHLLDCGLATAELLSGDLVREPLHVEHGAIEVPRSPGLGIEVDDTALARWQVTP